MIALLVLGIHRELVGDRYVRALSGCGLTWSWLTHALSWVGVSTATRDADRWIAAIAIHLSVPLVSHDGIFPGAPRLDFETALDA